jgi:hypothetical protein
MTSFTSVFGGGNCADYSYSAAWTSVVGATSYDLFMTATDDTAGSHSATISGVGGTSISWTSGTTPVDASWCAATNVFLSVRAHNACGTSAFSSARQIGGAGAACC